MICAEKDCSSHGADLSRLNGGVKRTLTQPRLKAVRDPTQTIEVIPLPKNGASGSDGAKECFR